MNTTEKSRKTHPERDSVSKFAQERASPSVSPSVEINLQPDHASDHFGAKQVALR